MKNETKRKKSKVEREARKLLADSGLPHEFRLGTRHVKVFIGDTLALTLSKGDVRGKDCKLLETTIKKFQKAASCN